MILHLRTAVGARSKLPNTIVILLAVAALFFAPSAVNAGEKYNDSAPFLCVPTSVVECVNDGECRPGTAESNNLPDFFKVNLKERTVGSEDKKRFSPIKVIDRSKNELTLYGSESGRSWVLMIQENSGRMSASITGDGESFAIFGVCPSP